MGPGRQKPWTEAKDAFHIQRAVMEGRRLEFTDERVRAALPMRCGQSCTPRCNPAQWCAPHSGRSQVASAPGGYLALLHECWKPDPMQRPLFNVIFDSLTTIAAQMPGNDTDVQAESKGNEKVEG